MLNKLEKKFGRFAIPNLTLYLIGSYVLGYILSFVGDGAALSWIAFYPPLILSGEIWRLISWVIMPAGSFDILMVLMLFIFYQFGTILEKTWGSFRFNVYVLSGIIITVIGGFITYAISPAASFTLMSFSTYYISLSIFLAVAAMYPNMEVMLYFIIPIKFKWAAVIHLAYLGYMCFKAFSVGAIGTVVLIIASLVNCALMMYLVKNDYTSPGAQFKNARRKAEFKRKVNEGRKEAASMGYRNASGTVTKHKCAICGRTELDGDELEFRFCSKCEGNYEYCQDHLFTHQHVKRL